MSARSGVTEAGFTYLEVLLAAALLAGTTTTIGYALAHARDVDAHRATLAQGRYLLQDGIAWARMLPRVDSTTPTGFGMETGETTLAHVDDVDDLHDIVETGPADRAGTAASSDWTRTWSVRSADLTLPTKDATDGSTDLLRVSIVIAYQGRQVANTTFLLSRTP